MVIPRGVGQVLFNHYNGGKAADQKKREALVGLGDISILRPEIGVKHPFDMPSRFTYSGTKSRTNPAYTRWKKQYGDMCLAYGRDRGEKNIAAFVGDNLHAAWPNSETGTEFTYVWTKGQWWVGDPDEGSQSIVALKDVLEGNAKITSAIKAFGGNFVIGKRT
jgi:hypothetical protein